MISIELTCGRVVLVDDEDAGLSAYCWRASRGSKTYYSMRSEGPANQRSTIMMHRQITAAGDLFEVDHINGNGLDNRRSNLRLVTHAENARNSGAHRDSKSGVKGVTWDKRRSRWVARIMVNGRTTNLGRFEHLEDAAEMYAKAARLLHGEYAREAALWKR